MSIPAYTLATPASDALGEVRKLLVSAFRAHALADSLHKWGRLITNHPDYNHERHGTAADAIAVMGQELAKATATLTEKLAEAEAAAPWAVPTPPTSTGLDMVEYMVGGSSPPLFQATRELCEAVVRHTLIPGGGKPVDSASLGAVIQGMVCYLKSEAGALGQLHPTHPPDLTFKPANR